MPTVLGCGFATYVGWGRPAEQLLGLAAVRAAHTAHCPCLPRLPAPHLPFQGVKRYYLGVLHFWRPTNHKDGRSYHHYLYKMEAEPPFRALQVRLVVPTL